MHYIHHNIKFYRTYNRFTQAEVATQLKTTLERVKTYESGVASPQIDMLVRIADMMQISIDTLIKVKLSEKNYLRVKGEGAPDLLSRIEVLEITVNKTVDKIQKKGAKTKIVK